jgi:hypothetical protein
MFIPQIDEPEQRRQFLLIEFANTLAQVLPHIT